MAAAAMPFTQLDEYLPVCINEPERWTATNPDEQAKALCIACPRRWLCAREAYQMPGAQGLWAGVVIPESGRAREFALHRLRGLAQRGGYQVQPRRRGRPRGSRN